MGADHPAHVLDDAKYRDLEFFNKFRCLDSVHDRNILRGGHDDCPFDIGGVLRDRECLVAGPRREIHNQIIERPPVHLVQELLNRTHLHRPPPDDRAGGIRQDKCH